MADETWPAPTPRDEMLARVVTRGRRIQMVNRIMVGLVVAGAAAVGAVGVALGTSGAIDLFDDGAAPPVETPGGGVPYASCPGTVEVGRLRGGDRVYLTGRDESGDWVELRSPVDQIERVWVRADVVEPDAVVDLAVVSCDVDEIAMAVQGVDATTTTVAGEELPPEETATTTAAPGPTSTTVAPGPGPNPPPPPPPPPPADTTGPSISDHARTAGLIREDSEFCNNFGAPITTEVSVLVSDPSGVASVQLRWSFTLDGTVVSGSKPMSLSGGRYRAAMSFPVVAGGSSNIVNTNWSVRATDGLGNVTTSFAGPNSSVELQGCAH